MKGMAKISIEQAIEQTKDSRKDILQKIFEVREKLIDELSKLCETGFSKERMIYLLETAETAEETDYEDFEKVSKSKVQALIASLETISDGSASEVYETILKCEEIDDTLTSRYYLDLVYSLERLADDVLRDVEKAISCLEEAKGDFERI